MAALKNLLATKSMTEVLRIRLSEQVYQILTEMLPRVNALTSSGAYLAIQDHIVTGLAEDIGNVRVSGYLYQRFEYTELYKDFVSKRKDLTDIATVASISPEVEVGFTLQTEAFGQVRAVVRVASGATTFNKDSVQINYDGSVGTLWFNEATKALTAVQGAALLGAAQYIERLDEQW